MIRYQKKHSPTYHPDHYPIFISFFHLPRSIASSLFKLRTWQSFCTTSLHVLFGLPLGLEPLHLIFHTFLLPISVFFLQHARTIATCFGLVSILYHLFLVFQFLTSNSIFYLNITHPFNRSHLWLLKCHLIFTARRSYASAVLGVVILSVRLSVTRVLCDFSKEPAGDIYFLYHMKGQSF